MAMDAPVNTFNLKYVDPAMAEDLAVSIDVNLGPNLTIARGTVLGQVTASANDVQTLTVTGAPTGGSFSLTIINPITGSVVTFNNVSMTATAATIQGLCDGSFGAGNFTVGGGPLPGTAITFTGAKDFANQPIQPIVLSNVVFVGGTAPAASIAHTTTGATAATYAPYASGHTDGTQTGKAIAQYDYVTDAGGNVTFGSQGGGGDLGQTFRAAPVWIKGIFSSADLVGVDAGLIAQAQWLLKEGTITAGLIELL